MANVKDIKGAFQKRALKVILLIQLDGLCAIYLHTTHAYNNNSNKTAQMNEIWYEQEDRKWEKERESESKIFHIE